MTSTERHVCWTLDTKRRHGYSSAERINAVARQLGMPVAVVRRLEAEREGARKLSSDLALGRVAVPNYPPR